MATEIFNQDTRVLTPHIPIPVWGTVGEGVKMAAMESKPFPSLSFPHADSVNDGVSAIKSELSGLR